MERYIKLGFLYGCGICICEVFGIRIFRWLQHWKSSAFRIETKKHDASQIVDEMTLALNTRKPPDVWNTAIFFPDLTPSTDITYLTTSTTAQFLSYFQNARLSIYMCILLSSLHQLKEIIQQKSQNLSIKVITDYDTLTAHDNFNCKSFIRSNIPVRAKNTGSLMHNKFVIIDDEAVLTGSLNFTKTAITKNYENIVITTNRKIVEKYKKEFAKIWIESEDCDRSILRSTGRRD